MDDARVGDRDDDSLDIETCGAECIRKTDPGPELLSKRHQLESLVSRVTSRMRKGKQAETRRERGILERLRSHEQLRTAHPHQVIERDRMTRPCTFKRQRRCRIGKHFGAARC